MTGLALLGLTAALWAAWAAPIDTGTPPHVGEGMIQKTLYLHVPSANMMYLSLAVTVVASILFLVKKSRAADRVALVGAELTVLFGSIVLATGPIWARPIWNTWWQFDARLTSTLVLWFLYVGCLVVRPLAADQAQGARWAAVVAIIGALDAPIVHWSVTWWQTLHPRPAPGSGILPSPELGPGMHGAFLLGMLAFPLLWGALFAARLALEKLEDLAPETRS